MFKSFDGTNLGYQTMGKGKKVIILCNGLGGTVVAWKPLYDRLADSYKIISWDYRGLFRSDPPSDESHLTIKDHVHDLRSLIEREKVKQVLVCGWSMGVQVALEYYRQNPRIFTGMILLNGTYGYPFNTALNSPLSRFILPKINDLAKKYVPAFQPSIRPLAHRLIDWEGFVSLIAKLGLVHENLDKKIFKEVAREILSADLRIYHEIMRHLSEHDAADVLPTVKVPTLVIAGDEDRITPLKVAEKMAREIPKAELFIVPHGTHYSLLEFPEIILLRVRQFLSEHGS